MTTTTHMRRIAIPVLAGAIAATGLAVPAAHAAPAPVIGSTAARLAAVRQRTLGDPVL